MIRPLMTLCAVLAISACKGDSDDTEDDSGTPTTPDTCDVTVTSSSPGSGAEDVFFRTPLEFRLSVADPTASVSVSDGSADVAGSTVIDGDIVTFEPTDGFTPGEAHTATISLCDGVETVDVQFSVSEAGQPVDPATLEGTTYLLDLASGNFIQPAGIGPLLSTQITVDILLGVLEADASEVTMIGALGAEASNPPTQDLCAPSIDFPVADFAGNPFFEVGPDNVEISIQGVDIEIDELYVSGAFSPDGDGIEGAVLQGIIDTRPLVPLVAPGGEDDAVCALTETFGIVCEPCISGGDFCLSILVDSIQAGGLGGESLVVRTLEEVLADPVCNPPPDPMP